jgi:hypothetical protein
MTGPAASPAAPRVRPVSTSPLAPAALSSGARLDISVDGRAAPAAGSSVPTATEPLLWGSDLEATFDVPLTSLGTTPETTSRGLPHPGPWSLQLAPSTPPGAVKAPLPSSARAPGRPCPQGEPSGRLPRDGPSDGLNSDGIHRTTMCEPVAREYAARRCRVGFSRGLLDRPLLAARHKTMLSTRNKARQGLPPRCRNT